MKQKHKVLKRKYEFTDETKFMENVCLHRIRALVDIPAAKVKKGDLGGWIEREKNLSHEGSCWVFDEAIVKDSALVSGNAQVRDNATVYCNASVKGNSVIANNATIAGNGKVMDKAKVCGNARVSGRAVVCWEALVTGNVIIRQSARIADNSFVGGNAYICGYTELEWNAAVVGNVEINCGCISIDASVNTNNDVISISNLSKDRDKDNIFTDIATFYKCLDKKTGKNYVGVTYKNYFYTLTEFEKFLTEINPEMKPKVMNIVKARFVFD